MTVRCLGHVQLESGAASIQGSNSLQAAAAAVTALSVCGQTHRALLATEAMFKQTEVCTV